MKRFFAPILLALYSLSGGYLEATVCGSSAQPCMTTFLALPANLPSGNISVSLTDCFLFYTAGDGTCGVYNPGYVLTGDTSISASSTYSLSLDTADSPCRRLGPLEIDAVVSGGFNLSYSLPQIFQQVCLPPGYEFIDFGGSDGQHIQLNIQWDPSRRLSGNPKAVAHAITCSTGHDLTMSLFQILGSVHSTDDLADALDRLHPAVLKQLAVSQQETTFHVRMAFSHRTKMLYNTRCGRGAPHPNNGSVWAEGYADFSHQHSTKNHIGYSNNTEGFVAGADGMAAKNSFIGAGFGYTNTALTWHEKHGTGWVNSYYAGAYGTWFNRFLFLNASGLFELNRYGAHRRIHFGTLKRVAKSSHNGWGANGHFDLGGIFFPRSSIAEMRPFAGIDYNYLHKNNIKENGARGLDLKVKHRNYSMVRTELGFDFSRCYCRGCSVEWTPDLSLSWVYERRLKGGKFAAQFVDGGCPFVIDALYRNRNLFVPEVGVTGLFLGEQLQSTLLYHAEVGRRYWDQEANVQLVYAF